MALVCTSCEESVEDEANWYEQDEICMACLEVGGGSTYCCGAIYENGEETCGSCGEPL
ncbi:hypothetical protein SZ00_02018 [Rhodococcus sp. AD45]|nr:hypothetical protein SZ00_02018 [Rhodococcus sp. AD45]